MKNIRLMAGAVFVLSISTSHLSHAGYDVIKNFSTPYVHSHGVINTSTGEVIEGKTYHPVSLISASQPPFFTQLECHTQEPKSGSQPCSKGIFIEGNFPAAATLMSDSKKVIDTSEENRIFDQSKTTPEKLLLEFYKNNRALFLGKSSHENYEIYENLIHLLKEVGTDPKLKIIAIERSHITEDFYKVGSTQELNPEKVRQLLPTAAHKHGVLFPGRKTDPYLISVFLPFVRKLNDKRKELSLDPVTVVPVDSYEYGKPEPIVKYSNGLRPDQLDHSMSRNREAATQKNFETKVLSQLGDDGKVITVYHLAHLIQGREGYLPTINEDENLWESPTWQPGNWLGTLYEKNPSLKSGSKIVVFDEEDLGYAPNDTFTFTRRQTVRHPHEAFAVPLAPFKNVHSERGLSVFDSKTSFHNSLFDGMYRSSASLPEMVDALIYTPNAREKSALKKSEVLKKCSSILGCPSDVLEGMYGRP